jgi:hypothetical protein
MGGIDARSNQGYENISTCPSKGLTIRTVEGIDVNLEWDSSRLGNILKMFG